MAKTAAPKNMMFAKAKAGKNRPVSMKMSFKKTGKQSSAKKASRY
jgi:hypothetical protein